jgi:hypothetical protein
MSSDINPANEITVNGERIIWEMHKGQAYSLDCMMLHSESTTLGLCGAIVLCHPLWSKKARMRRSVADAAERMMEVLIEKGWSMPDIIRAGSHALAYLMVRLPPTPGSEDVEEAKVFTEPAPESTSAGS